MVDFKKALNNKKFITNVFEHAVLFSRFEPKQSDNRGFPAVADGTFDRDLFDALKEKYLPAPRPDTSDLTWQSKDRRETPIKEMDTKHLVNTIRMIEDGRHGSIKEGHKMHTALRDDLNWRKQLVSKLKKKNKTKKRAPGGVFFKEEE